MSVLTQCWRGWRHSALAALAALTTLTAMGSRRLRTLTAKLLAVWNVASNLRKLALWRITFRNVASTVFKGRRFGNAALRQVRHEVASITVKSADAGLHPLFHQRFPPGACRAGNGSVRSCQHNGASSFR